jgi:hypothetical protein
MNDIAYILGVNNELEGALREIVRGGNGSTAPVLSALKRHAPGLLKDIRAALAKVQS